MRSRLNLEEVEKKKKKKKDEARKKLQQKVLFGYTSAKHVSKSSLMLKSCACQYASEKKLKSLMFRLRNYYTCI